MDVFMALDLHKSKRKKHGHSAQSSASYKEDEDDFYAEEAVKAISSIFSPVATTLRKTSAGLSSTLHDCGLMIKNAEGLRGSKYEWILRMRPDVRYGVRVPSYEIAGPILSQIKSKYPKLLIADYVGDGMAGGCSKRSDVCRLNSCCADDNFGLMTREALEPYFLTDWNFDARRCAPKRYCMECILGCSMHVHDVRLATIDVKRDLARSLDDDARDISQFSFQAAYTYMAQAMQTNTSFPTLDFSTTKTFYKQTNNGTLDFILKKNTTSSSPIVNEATILEEKRNSLLVLT